MTLQCDICNVNSFVTIAGSVKNEQGQWNVQNRKEGIWKICILQIVLHASSVIKSVPDLLISYEMLQKVSDLGGLVNTVMSLWVP
jgi:hypothetical protein